MKKTSCKWLAVGLCCIFFRISAVENSLAWELLSDTTHTLAGETVPYMIQVPTSYSEESPPAIVVSWHSLGTTESSVFTATYIDSIADMRGWFLASHYGPDDRHWNANEAQLHCLAMLQDIEENYSFARDSIYMIGESMGGAGGQVWHNNNCGINDYFTAATAGASQILDCQLRQEQYLAAGDTNRSMRAVFGGLPSEGDSIAYQYHRYSAVHLADTNESMHFNSLTLPVWDTWGSTIDEDTAYGIPAQSYLLLRTTGSPHTEFFPAGFQGHGFDLVFPENMLAWLSQFSANRYPDELSISADEDDVYYYTKISLAGQPYTFGRYGISKSFEERRLDITLIRNIAGIAISFGPEWTEFDQLSGDWENLDDAVENVQLRLCSVPAVQSVVRDGSIPVPFTYDSGDLVIQGNLSGHYTVQFESALQNTQSGIPEAVLLSGFPNPFNSTLTLIAQSQVYGMETLFLRDILGRVAAEIQVNLIPGENSVSINGDNLTSGIYFVQSKNFETAPLKIMLLK